MSTPSFKIEDIFAVKGKVSPHICPVVYSAHAELTG